MKKADWILIGSILFVAGVLAAFLYFVPKNGSAVTVEINGKTVDRLPLSEDTTKAYADENGGTNLLVIENGKARITEANCPDKICVHHRAISRSGESIICLPHKLVVTVINEKETDGVDARAG